MVEEAELQGSSFALFDDSDVAGIFHEDTLRSLEAKEEAKVPELEGVLASRSLGSFQEQRSGAILESNDASLALLDRQKEEIAQLKEKNEEVVQLKEQIHRLEQDNVTLLDELDKVSLDVTEEKRLRSVAEQTVASLEMELESLRRQCLELSSNVRLNPP